MALKFENLAEIAAHGFDAVIDVRSPAEFAEDHIPGAINLPVLDDKERARVGTIYKQESAFKAKKVGAALVARNAARHLDGPLADKDGAWRPLVYCWRGGQRSGSFATILAQIGWRAEVLAGGYQTYRRLVNRAVYGEPLVHPLLVLEGNTGTAKTELLHLLAGRGLQVVDLEGLAAHRGSVFGAVEHAQPSQKAFEGALAATFGNLDPTKIVLVEAESSKIGRLIIPPSIWQAMKVAPRLRVSATLDERAGYLTRAYGDISGDSEQLSDTLSALIRHQGRETVEHWQELVRAGELQDLARELMENHYDPSYARARAGRPAQVFAELGLDDLSTNGLEKAARQLETLVGEYSDQMQAK